MRRGVEGGGGGGGEGKEKIEKVGLPGVYTNNDQDKTDSGIYTSARKKSFYFCSFAVITTRSKRLLEK